MASVLESPRQDTPQIIRACRPCQRCGTSKATLPATPAGSRDSPGGAAVSVIKPLLHEAAEAGLSFRFADGEIRLCGAGKAPPPDLLSRLRAARPAIIAHFERAHQLEQFIAAVQAIWPGAIVVNEDLSGEAEEDP
ncbi:MAG: hypothetical protein WCC90_16600 [Methylocella sp.]